MRQAGAQRHAFAFTQPLIDSEGVGNEIASVSFEPFRRFLVRAGFREADDRRLLVAQGPEVTAMTLAGLAFVQHLNRCIVDVNKAGSQKLRHDDFHDRFQKLRDLSNGPGHGRLGDLHAMPPKDLLQPVERQVIAVLARQDVG